MKRICFDSGSNLYMNARKVRLVEKHGDFLAGKLANTYRDAKFTHHLFDLYLESGDRVCTFINDKPVC